MIMNYKLSALPNLFVWQILDLFPQLDHQKRVIAKSMKMQQWSNKQKPKGRPTKLSDKSDDSDSSQNRRSRSKERNASKKRDT